MNKRSLLGRSRVAAVLLLASVAIGPVAAPAQTPDKTQASELKSLGDARKVKDPQKKIDALEKFLADFPDSFMRTSVRQTIVATLIKNWPDQKERISAQADKAVESAGQWDKGDLCLQIADALMEAHILPGKAEELAAKALAITEKNLEEQNRKYKASYVAALGRAYLNSGKTQKAEEILKQAYSDDPQAPATARGLAELAAKKGNFEEGLSYEISAFVSNQSNEEPRTRTKLEEMYRKTHGGSLDGLDATLDAAYKKASPNPIEAKPYHPAGAQPDRTVLAELFTGSGCGPCAGADLAFDALAERYPHQNLAVLVYHLHIPRPDPMTNPSTQARAGFYTAVNTPSYAIDGVKNIGGGSREMAGSFYNRLSGTIDGELDKPAEASIKLTASLENNTVKAEAVVDKIKSDAKSLKLQVALVEDTIHYSGENGIRFHTMVVRSLGGEKAGGYDVKPGSPADIKQQFDLAAISAELKKSLDDYEAAGHRGEEFKFTEEKYEIDRKDLSVVAFIQDPETKHVLQAVYVRVSASTQAAQGK